MGVGGGLPTQLKKRKQVVESFDFLLPGNLELGHVPDSARTLPTVLAGSRAAHHTSVRSASGSSAVCHRVQVGLGRGPWGCAPVSEQPAASGKSHLHGPFGVSFREENGI